MGDRNKLRSTGRRGAGRSPDRCGFSGKPLHAISRFRHQYAQTPPSPLVGEGGGSHRGRFSGKPLRAISRLSHQDAQTPPSPRVGEGGRGEEGQKRTGMQNIAHLSQKLYT